MKVLVADGDPSLRTYLKAELSTLQGFDVVGEASDGLELLRKVEARSPQIVLLGARLPRMLPNTGGALRMPSTRP